jgi:hypothetical protein
MHGQTHIKLVHSFIKNDRYNGFGTVFGSRLQWAFLTLALEALTVESVAICLKSPDISLRESVEFHYKGCEISLVNHSRLKLGASIIQYFRVYNL